MVALTATNALPPPGPTEHDALLVLADEPGTRTYRAFLPAARSLDASNISAAAQFSGEVNKMLIALDEREREILRLRFGLDRASPAP